MVENEAIKKIIIPKIIAKFDFLILVIYVSNLDIHSQRLNNPSFFEDRVGASFVDGFDGLGGEGKGEGFLQFGHIDTLLLKIHILADHAGRVELGSTSAVGVASAYA